MTRNRQFIVFLILFLIIGWLNLVVAGEIHVQAAASLTDVLKEIGALYEKQSGDKLLFNFASSNILAIQIQQGAPADIYFSADEAKMDQLEKKGLIRKDTRISLLSNVLCIIVRADSSLRFFSASDLTKITGNIAIAEPQSVPAGIYAKEYLKKIKIWDKISDRLVPVENVRATLSTVELGNADAGIVYRTDAQISKRVKVAYIVPKEEGPRISYPISILTETKSLEAARKAYDFLIGIEAKKIYKKYNFLVIQ